MRFLDRISRHHLSDLPDEILPGRYCVLEKLLLNHHTHLESGDPILDDGSGGFQVREFAYRFQDSILDDETAADAELTLEAIQAISDKVNSHGGEVSPILPPELADNAELEEIERLLRKILDAGHLHAIADRPRRDLRYDDIVAPVERVRKLSTGSLNHLASHSDCWQRRTLSGVLPRKVLARFSEDDYSIYENRLFKRLIDRIDRHLTKRLALLKSLNDRLAKALDFQESEKTHFELRYDICSLWGEAHQSDKMGKQLNASKVTECELGRQLQAIRGIKQRGLYRLVPASAIVPAQVYRTNILNHDAHYRHLPILWESLLNEDEDSKLDPDERLSRQKRSLDSYTDYVGLVIRRALQQYEFSVDGGSFFSWSGKKFTLKKEGCDWEILASNGKEKLRFTPIVWFGKTTKNFDEIDISTILCLPKIDFNGNNQNQLSVTPLDLYVVERVGVKIDEWLWRGLIKSLMTPLGPLPGPIKALIAKWPDHFIMVSHREAKLINRLDQAQCKQLMEEARSCANLELVEAFESAIARMEFLSTCRCGGIGRLTRNITSLEDFYFQCDACSRAWGMKSQSGIKRFTLHIKGNAFDSAEAGFLFGGRSWLDIEI